MSGVSMFVRANMVILDDYTKKKRKEIAALCGKIYFQNQLRADKLLVQNIGRIVTDVTKVSNLAQSFLSTYRLILEGVPVTNGPNYR